MDLLRSLPIGLYLEQPITWLHRLDARIKLVWLMSFLLAPLLASSLWRLGLVGLLILITLTARIPLRVWKRQMGWLLMFCGLLFAISCILPDGLTVEHQPRLPPDEIAFSLGETAENAAPLPQPTPYRYVLIVQGPLTVTRYSLDLGLRISTLLFTLVYSTNLYLLTTASEEIAAGLESLMKPLRWLKIPVTEIALTLTLSLRFFPLVLEEIQNLYRSVRTRAIDWKKLGLRRATQIWLLVAERLLENLLLRAEQISNAMKVRGFTSPNRHRVEWHQLRIRWRDWIALAGLTLFWGLRLIWGWEP
ncbi:energy-coupling factor transporter transmembrane protein EcfT [Lyngbya sp. CCY1209]|jgi:energy-coupling factor transport system permease protein|uniref:energy-coupling factor transporter transmembrane component T family protein n=1 Tax=Lyngbya sp. CCY1209 TaxID=2886103 RepID=UPI002D2081D4|nr:energy-coupling factor transporter transmembrane protein EcfT [Lyngbya sp. CCY1209]MEB3886936.1 energy-coupling factor transporter transmembrane protein EcfT [Lyngbya sp. CCY1209]